MNPQITHRLCRYGWAIINSLAVILQSDTVQDKKPNATSLSFETEAIHYPVETKTNVCILLKLLAVASKEFAKDLAFLIPTLNELKQSNQSASLKVAEDRSSPEPTKFDEDALRRKVSTSFKGIIGDASKKELRKLFDGNPDLLNSAQSLVLAAGDLLSTLKPTSS